MYSNYTEHPWLLVEDDEVDQILFTKAYKEAGISNPLVIKNNGEDALDYLRKNGKHPFMIISDINMPRMNGLELLKELKSDPNMALKNIPFIIFSSSTSETEVERSYEFGVQGYFQKPIKQVEFVKIVLQIKNYWIACELPYNIK
jgi:CheY-like chemotaxis protein